MPLSGPLFALLTPFDESGDIAQGSFEDSLRFLHERKARAVVTGGTTGEFPSLTHEERIRLFQIARRAFPGIIVNNVSACSAREANDLARRSEGAEALLLLPPYYYASPTEDGLVAFYEEALCGVSLPTVLYHFPKHAKIAFTPALVNRLRDKLPQIVGLKDSGGSWEDSQKFHASCKGLQLFIGNDKAALDTLKAGMAGSISGSANPFPEYLTALEKSWRDGEKEKAESIMAAFNQWNAFRATLGADGIAVAKYALSKRLPGFPEKTRAPLPALNEPQKQKIDAILSEITAQARALL